MFLRRNQTSMKVAPLDQAFDAKVYESNETEIIWMSTHLLKFKCQFDLYYLPFDNQTCYVELEVSEEEKNKIKLNPWGLRVNMTSTLNKFTVTNCEHEVHPNKFYLA